MLRELRSMISGKFNHDRYYNLRRKSVGTFRGRFEALEDRRMLAIDWVNAAAAATQFATDFGAANGAFAVQIVQRAIADWNQVITDQNFDNDNDPETNDFQLTVTSADLGGGIRGQAQVTDFVDGTDPLGWELGVPQAATITLDDAGGNGGWFFDTTPLDDIEFTGIADAFQSSFVDATTAGQQAQNDFYRTVTHEIGHVLGVFLDAGLSSGNFAGTYINTPQNPLLFAPDGAIVPAQTVDARLGNLQYVGPDQFSNADGLRLIANPDGSPVLNGDETAVIDELWLYTFGDGSGRTVTFTESGGGHFYEGPVNANTPDATSHPNELLNAGRVVPAGNNPAETTRQFISDLTVAFLEDAYDYTVTLPSELQDVDAHPDPDVFGEEFSTDTAHIMLDQVDRTLLIQGLASDPGAPANSVTDNITVAQVGNDIRVTVAYTPTGEEARTFTRDIPADLVQRILIAGNGAAPGQTDTIDVAAALDSMTTRVDYVVSSNQDLLEDAGSAGGGLTNDGIVDINTIIPGNQTTLRAAIVESNAIAGAQSIYVGRGHYDLTLTGTDNASAVGDLDITGDVTIVGAGAGLSVIDGGGAAGLNDRIFHVLDTGDLDLSRVTVTGGEIAGHGGAFLVGGTLTLTDSAVIDNRTTENGDGGGAIIGWTNSSVTVEGVVFEDNVAGGRGGALRFLASTSTHSVANSVFVGNTSQFNETIFISDGATVTNLGNNLTDDNGSGFFDTNLGDHIDTTSTITTVTSVADEIVAGDNAYALTLREAVQAANGSNGTVWLPAWHYNLTLAGTDNAAAVGDLDITGDVTIVGAGAGLSVIDGGGAAGLNDRIFHVLDTGDLDLSRVTVTGGEIAGHGGAFLVGGTLTLTDSAVIDNRTTENGDGGGAIIGWTNSSVTVEGVVFEDNVAGGRGGALRFLASTSTHSVANSVFVGNTSQFNETIFISDGATVTNLGNNLTDDNGSGFFDTNLGDHIDTTSTITTVTSVMDEIVTVDNTHALTLREAVQAANGSNGTVWLPAWHYNLTLAGTDNASAVGDLDITGDVTIVGAGAGLSVIDGGGAVGLNDRIFHVLDTGDLDLSRVTVTGGFAPSSGGGISVAGTLTLTDSVLIDNKTDPENTSSAGGGGLYGSTNSSISVDGVVFQDNLSTGRGGALRLQAGTGVHSVVNSLFVDNSSNNTESETYFETLGANVTNLGNNLTDDNESGFFNANLGDHIDTTSTITTVTSVMDEIVTVDNTHALTLREAVQAANGSNGTVWLPAWRYNLLLTGSETSDASFNDLDITGDVTIVGAGAGLSIIDASGLSNDGVGASDRIFEVTSTGDLDLSRVTITGGASLGSGGAFVVNGSGSLTLTDSAVVGNKTNGGSSGGGAIVAWANSSLTVDGVVFEDNQSVSGNGGALRLLAGTGTHSIANSVFVDNKSINSTTKTIYATGTGNSPINGGNNLTDDNGSGFFNGTGDHVGSVDYVVTSVVDAVDADLTNSLAQDASGFTTLRAAVQESNDETGTQTIWLPAWDFVLTIVQDLSLPTPYMDSTTGDLVITEDLSIRGIASKTKVDGSIIGVDDVFEVLGDYNDDDEVNALDFLAWQRGEAGADGDEDGDVDGDDYNIWNNYNGMNELDLTNVI